MSFRVHVDELNPGQFFACCALLELADRLTGHARGAFGTGTFEVVADCTLTQLLDRLTGTQLVQLDADDETASAVRLGVPFGLLVDWWHDTRSGGRELKVWAGRMSSVRIAKAMVAALADPRFHGEDLFDVGCVVRDPGEPTNKVEPFYFDARRAPNAHSRDVGFSTDALELTTTAHPAVEALCFFGLQRFRPSPTPERRVFEYCTWTIPLEPPVAASVANGATSVTGRRLYRFENWFRTGQRKHKAFRPAVLVEERTPR